VDKDTNAFRTISEVAEELDVPKHVLRFWEAKFPQIRPMKRGGGRRYYRPEDLELLRGIRHLLHAEGYTIKGVQKILREQGIEQVKRSWRERAASPDKARSAAATPRSSNAAAPSRAQPKQPPVTGEQRRLIEQLVAELEGCRVLLGGGTRRAPGAAKRGKRASIG